MKKALSLFMATLVGIEAAALLPAAVDVIVPSASANPALLRQARTQYDAGDIPGAMKTLERLLKPSPKVGGAQLEDARKLYGISQFLMGNKNGAGATFRQVLAANPRARLNPKDVLDPSISSFFEQQRRQAGRGGGRASAPRAQAPRAQAPRGFTGIFLTTNAPRATVFSNGIFIGTENQNISLDPGNHVITVSSEGFETVTKSFSLKPNEKLTISVKMERAGAREAAAAAAAARARKAREAREAREAEADRQRQAKVAKAAAAKSRARVNYNQELSPGRGGSSLADEFFRDGSTAVAPPPPPPPPPPPAPVYEQPVAPAPQAPVYSAQPSYPAPAPAPAPAPVAPAPVYQPTPTPLPPPAPVYVQPAPTYPTYHQPAPQPVAPVPVARPRYAPPSVSPYQPYQPATPPGQSQGKQKSTAMALLPFGVGQFQNGQDTKGWLFLGGQAAALIGFGYTYMALSSYKEQDAKALADDPSEETGHAGDPKYRQDVNDYISSQETYQMLYLAGFGALWIWGVIDAYQNLDAAPPKRQYGMYPRRMRLGSTDAGDDQGAELAQAHAPAPVEWKFEPVVMTRGMGAYGLRINVRF